MKSKSIFELIHEVLEKNKVPAVLIGGFAVNAHKYSRQTVDIDFLITDEDYDRIAADFKNMGFGEVDRQKLCARLQAPFPHSWKVDIVFADKDTTEKIMKEGKEVKISGVIFKIPSLPHLIALKLHAIKQEPRRELKDLQDIVELIRNNKMDIRTSGFRDLCLRHGNERLYNMIVQYSG